MGIDLIGCIASVLAMFIPMNLSVRFASFMETLSSVRQTIRDCKMFFISGVDLQLTLV